MLKARFILPAIIGLLILGSAAMAAGAVVDASSAQTSNNVVVHLPTVVALKIDGTGSGASADDVTFTVNAATYYNNAVGGATLNPDTSGFVDLKGFTNDTADASLVVGVTDAAGTAASTAVLSALKLNGAAISSFTATVTPGAPQTLINRNDFTLNLTGAEPQGDYTYAITYTLTAN